MKVFKRVLCLVVLVAAGIVGASGVFGAERVVVIGDEVVVDGATESSGLISQLRRTFAEEKKDVEVVPLGVRRSTFEDWRALVAKSYEENAPTDVEGVALKDELDKGADVVFVCLGRNDVFKPTFASPFKESDVVSMNPADPALAGASLVDDVAGLVKDLKKRTPGVRRVVLVSPYYEYRRDATAGMIAQVARFVETAAKKTSSEFVPLNDVFEPAQRSAWFATDQIDLAFDDFRPTEYGSQIATWAFLLALGDKRFEDAYRAAQTFYALSADRVAVPGVTPPRAASKSDVLTYDRDEWERVARRYYETRVDSRLRDAESPGVFLSPQYRVFDSDAARLAAALDTSWRYERDMSDAEKEAVLREKDNPDKRILATVMCSTRGIEADQPRTYPDGTEVAPRGTTSREGLDKAPKIEVVSCGDLRFDRIDERRSSPGRYVLHFNGTLSNLPVDITLRVAGIEKTARIEKEPEYFVSDVSYLRQTFSSLDDFPQEKAITSVDFAALSGKDPVEYAKTAFNSAILEKESAELAKKSLMKRPPLGLLWNSRLQAASLWGIAKSQFADDDPDFVDITRYSRNESFSGVYVVRYVDVPDNQTATLKLGVKGYKTHVVERVYLNGAQVFFGELNVDDPEKQEATVQVQLKKGRNVMVARVDHTEWDWIVGFTLLDEEGRELQDSPGRW